MASDETGRGSLGRRLPPLIVCLGVVATLNLAGFRLPSLEPASSPFPEAVSGATPRTSDPWRDRKWLRLHMDQACGAVEWVCGTRFRSRPRLYVQPLDDLVAIYREEDVLRQERCGEEGQPGEQSWFKLYNDLGLRDRCCEAEHGKLDEGVSTRASLGYIYM